jgi:hypothetical protein
MGRPIEHPLGPDATQVFLELGLVFRLRDVRADRLPDGTAWHPHLRLLDAHPDLVSSSTGATAAQVAAKIRAKKPHVDGSGDDGQVAPSKIRKQLAALRGFFLGTGGNTSGIQFRDRRTGASYQVDEAKVEAILADFENKYGSSLEKFSEKKALAFCYALRDAGVPPRITNFIADSLCEEARDRKHRGERAEIAREAGIMARSNPVEQIVSSGPWSSGLPGVGKYLERGSSHDEGGDTNNPISDAAQTIKPHRPGGKFNPLNVEVIADATDAALRAFIAHLVERHRYQAEGAPRPALGRKLNPQVEPCTDGKRSTSPTCKHGIDERGCGFCLGTVPLIEVVKPPRNPKTARRKR